MYFIDRETQPEKWLEIWQALTAVLAGGEKETPFSNEEITLFCTNYAYEGTDTERGHCFTKRDKTGRKHAIYTPV